MVETPDRPFVTTEGEGTQTFAECRTAALAMAGTLRAAGVGAGDLVAVMAPNCRTAIHAWMGANLLGAADVMVNTGYRGSPLEHALNLVQAKVLLAEARFLGVLREAEPRLEHLKRIVWFRLPDGGDGAGREPAGFSGSSSCRLSRCRRRRPRCRVSRKSRRSPRSSSPRARAARRRA